MSTIEQQMEILKGRHPEVTIIPISDGSYQICIPNIPLPKGWTKDAITVKFIVPIGYPMARPDCFGVDADLKLANGNLPQSANFSNIPPNQEALLWFSWHLSSWNPNNDNLLTYVNVIKRRLQEPK